MSKNRHRARPLSHQLLLRSGLAVLLCVSALTSALLYLLHAHVHEQTDRMLLRLARQDAADSAEEGDEGVHVHESPVAVPSFQGVITSKYAFVLDYSCEVVAGTENVSRERIPIELCDLAGPEGTFAFMNVNGVSNVLLRVAALVARGPDDELYTFVVGVEHREIDTSLWRATRASIPISAAAALMILAAVWFATKRPSGELHDVANVSAALSLRTAEEFATARARLAGMPLNTHETAALVDTLIELLERVERTVRNEERFLAEAAHELRTPLTALQGEIELALRRERSAEEYEEALRWAQTDVTRLISLAENLLSASRARAERIETESIRVHEVVDAVSRRYESALMDAGLSVSIEVDDEARIHANREASEQVLVNLVSNSIAHSGGSRLSIRLHYDDHGAPTLRIEDDGSGIEPSLRAHLFDPFARRTESKGHGLGLYIARDLARKQGGELLLEESATGCCWVLSFSAALRD